MGDETAPMGSGRAIIAQVSPYCLYDVAYACGSRQHLPCSRICIWSCPDAATFSLLVSLAISTP